MMENKMYRWIAFAITVMLTVIAIAVGTISGFLCFVIAAFIFIPINHLFDKLDKELDPKYRRFATAMTACIFLVCGLFSFTTAGNGSTDSQTYYETTAITTTSVTTITERTTKPTTTTTIKTTTETTTTTTVLLTTTTEQTTEDIVQNEPIATQAAQPSQSNGQTVYVTPTGKKYHYDNNCNGGSYSPTDLDSALRRGLEPCKKCT